MNRLRDFFWDVLEKHHPGEPDPSREVGFLDAPPAEHEDEDGSDEDVFAPTYQCHGYVVPAGKRCPVCKAPMPLSGAR